MKRTAFLLILLACDGKDTTAEGPPTLTQVQDEVFTLSCAFAACHAAPGASQLVLEAGQTHAEVVDVDSVDNPGNILVVPGDSEASYLVAKLRGEDGIVGDQMPVGAPLEAERLQLVIDWIDAGAADN